MKVSIITIHRNMVAGLKETIDSVQEQTWKSIEHVIVDGASTDGAVELIKNRIRPCDRWLSEPDRGISDAFNKGVHLATGDYVIFLNAGDVFCGSDVVERFCVLAQKEDRPKVFVGDFEGLKGGASFPMTSNPSPEAFEWRNPINHQSSFIPLSLAIAYPYDERLKLGMDYDFWLRVQKHTGFQKLDFKVARFDLTGRSSDPKWAVHNLVVRRALWHINRGSRFSLGDTYSLFLRALKIRLRALVRSWLKRN